MLKITLKRMLCVSIAFIIFGIVDNGIMILAGSWIDATIAQTFGLSTMASAGMGNLISDAIGIVVGRIVENNLYKYVTRVKDEDLNEYLETFAEMFGICLGCALGMLFLLVV